MQYTDAIQKIDGPVYFYQGERIPPEKAAQLAKAADLPLQAARTHTISHGILSSHDTAGSADADGLLKIKFDAMASHDITYVGIIQTARASGLTEFPLPYVLTNCHNSLCAVGGTINEDDHVFGLSAAKKYGGIFVPPHIAVIHQYMREMFAGCGKMILGSDSHTRYGALGTMAIGEGGPELVKQLLGRTYDLPSPEITAVFLKGTPAFGVGPQDIAIALVGSVFADGFVKNSVLEFIGPGVGPLSVDFRIGIDVMTTETTCLSSIWQTDDKVGDYLAAHGRPEDYKPLQPGALVSYDKCVEIDLSAIRPMIALPFHPSKAVLIEEFAADPQPYLAAVEQDAAELLGDHTLPFHLTDKVRQGKLYVDQGVIAGCAGGGFENLCAAAEILAGSSTGDGEFALSVYPASQPIYMELVRNGCAEKLIAAGATIRTAFCGPCFGAGDVPANNGLSIRHSTRNFPNREGSKPGAGQMAAVALMDARSIAATAARGGALTGADHFAYSAQTPPYHFDSSIYTKRVYNGGKEPGAQLKFGPNIADWPAQIALCEHVLINVASVITDDVTTTDELIPSGETSSYRSNPLKLAEFTLSRKDPHYVARAKAVRQYEISRQSGRPADDIAEVLKTAQTLCDAPLQDIEIGSVVCAKKPGDGSAREQAASCQRVLGGLANIAVEYATKRYRSNLMNWGMLPFLYERAAELSVGDWIVIPNVRTLLKTDAHAFPAYVWNGNGQTAAEKIVLRLADLTPDERDIILKGCLINYYAAQG